MIGFSADSSLAGFVVPADTAGFSVSNSSFGISANIISAGIVIGLPPRSEDFDATGNWVWGDGEWIAWGDGDEIEL